MKKFLGILLVVAMVLSLAACGKKPAAGEENNPANGQTATQQTNTNSNNESANTEGTAVDTSDGKVTDPEKLGEAITYWVDGDYLYFKIKTSAEIDAHKYGIDIVNPGIYLTRDSEFINQGIYDNARAFAEDFDKEYYDGEYVFWVDNTTITGLASDESEWAPGTWSVLLFNQDTRLVLGQWLIVLEGGGKYHFEYSDSFLFGAGEDRKVKEFDSLQDEVESWFSFKADESYDEWAVFNFDGYYLEETDPQGYDSYYLMVCPEGDYITYEDADAVDLTYSVIGGLEYAKCPYRFAIEQYGIENGKYTIALAKMGGNVEVQFTAEKNGPTNWKMDFSNAKCPALESKYADGAPSDAEFPKDDPAEYSSEYWEAKYPGENICPFYIEENGIENSYYWVSGLDGWDGTMLCWISNPFNWNGWHKTADGCIVNKDETLKLTDNWANGDEALSSFCTVTTEKYDKDNTSDAESKVLASIGLSEADIKSSLGFELGTTSEADAQYMGSVAYDSLDSFDEWVEAVAESCRKASKDGNIYESEFSEEAMTSFDIDDSYAINMVQFIYRTSSKVVYVTLSSAGSQENTFLCNIQVY